LAEKRWISADSSGSGYSCKSIKIVSPVPDSDRDIAEVIARKRNDGRDLPGTQSTSGIGNPCLAKTLKGQAAPPEIDRETQHISAVARVKSHNPRTKLSSQTLSFLARQRGFHSQIFSD
jgi:hypothetical protein